MPTCGIFKASPRDIPDCSGDRACFDYFETAFHTDSFDLKLEFHVDVSSS